MSIGAPLFKAPCSTDPGFNLLKRDLRGRKKKILYLLKKWNRLHYIKGNQYDILMKMLCINEDKRIDIVHMIKHPYLRKYFEHCIISKKKSKSSLNKKTYSKKVNNDHSRSIIASETFTVENSEYCAFED